MLYKKEAVKEEIKSSLKLKNNKINQQRSWLEDEVGEILQKVE